MRAAVYAGALLSLLGNLPWHTSASGRASATPPLGRTSTTAAMFGQLEKEPKIPMVSPRLSVAFCACSMTVSHDPRDESTDDATGALYVGASRFSWPGASLAGSQSFPVSLATALDTTHDGTRQECIAVCARSSALGWLPRRVPVTNPHAVRRQGERGFFITAESQTRRMSRRGVNNLTKQFVGCEDMEPLAGVPGANGSLAAATSAESKSGDPGTGNEDTVGVCSAFSRSICGMTCAEEQASCEAESGCVWKEGANTGGACIGSCAELSVSTCGSSCADEEAECKDSIFGCEWKEGAFIGGGCSRKDAKVDEVSGLGKCADNFQKVARIAKCDLGDKEACKELIQRAEAEASISDEARIAGAQADTLTECSVRLCAYTCHFNTNCRWVPAEDYCMCTWAGCTCGDPAQNTTGSQTFKKTEMMYVAGPLMGAFGIVLFTACGWRWRRQMGEIAKEVIPQFVLNKFAIKEESETSSSSDDDEPEMGSMKRKQQKQDELQKRAKMRTKMREEADQRSKRGEYHLTLCIHECMYLPRLDQSLQDANLVGLSDPYVHIILADDHSRQEAQTEVKKSTLFPKFEQTFCFYFTASDKTKEKKETLTIQVWDWDLGKKNDFSGETVLRLQTLVAQYHARNDKSKPLEMQASDHLLYTYILTISYIHTCIHTYIHTYVYTYIHTYVQTYKHTYIHIHIYYIYIYSWSTTTLPNVLTCTAR